MNSPDAIYLQLVRALEDVRHDILGRTTVFTSHISILGTLLILFSVDGSTQGVLTLCERDLTTSSASITFHFNCDCGQPKPSTGFRLVGPVLASGNCELAPTSTFKVKMVRIIPQRLKSYSSAVSNPTSRSSSPNNMTRRNSSPAKPAKLPNGLILRVVVLRVSLTCRSCIKLWMTLLTRRLRHAIWQLRIGTTHLTLYVQTTN